MPYYQISIADVRSVTFCEQHANIEVARDATIQKALLRMLDEPAPKNPQTATCNVVEKETLEERSFKVSLSVVDLI